MESDQHPRFPRTLILPGEDPAVLDALVADFYRHFTPEGALERCLVDQLISHAWMIRRLHRGIVALERDPLINLATLNASLSFLEAKERSYSSTIKQLKAMQRRRQQKGKATPKRGELASFRQETSAPRRTPPAKTPQGEWIH